MKRSLWILLVLIVIAAGAMAQSTTANIKGKVQNERGDNIANAEINAVATQTGFVKTVNSRGDGTYQLSGLTPGEYQIVVAAPGYEPRNETITVLLGQNLEMNLRLSATAVLSESITVVGNQAVETKTSEVATNVTTQQIENLPQDDRNFLNFAALAPGIRISHDPVSKSFAGDAQNAEETNIFIDGVSTKNDILEGGTSGENSSRGNPFPQSAVQEFRVITQNYSAQYDHASSAIITAVTKSGGNQFRGQAFGFWQPKAWVEPTALGFGGATLTTNASYRRIQPGINFGGPIVKDKLNFFLTYEGDDERATTVVNLPAPGSAIASSGVFGIPFKQTLAFGKVSWQMLENQILDVSGNYRREHEIRRNGTDSYQSAQDVRNWVYGATARHQWNSSSALNEASLSLQKYGWNPTPLNPNLVGLNFQGCCRVGGYSTAQTFDQRRLEARDNYNFAPWNMAGIHNFQVGGNVDWMHYSVNKSLNGNPEFEFKNDPNNGFPFSFTNCTAANIGSAQCQPFEANFGAGNPILSTSNNEYGVYGQDSWAVNSKLQINLGLRWDYETSMLDRTFVTPANIVSALKGKTFNINGLTVQIPDSYFSTGTERKPYTNEWQPRLGFSYDLFANGKSVVFGGWGRYFDRLFLNSTLNERFNQQYPTYKIEFAAPGAPCGGSGQPLCWNPSYLSAAGIAGLVASGATKPEIYLLNNDTKPPFSNQWNLGFRQAFGTWVGSASYNAVHSYRQLTYAFASGFCCNIFLVPSLGDEVISDPSGGKRTWYDAESITLERPYTTGTHWGLRFVYTHARALQTGNDLYSFDLPAANLYAEHPVAGTEPNHINATGIVGLPFNLLFSTNITLGTGAATPVQDFTQGFDFAGRLKTGVFNRAVYPGRACTGCPSGKFLGFGYRDVDFRLQWGIPFMAARNVQLIGEVFNAFNWTNYGCLSNFLAPGDNPANAGTPNCVVSLGRREQLGVRVNF
jgi:hypothetical protein